MDKKTFRSISGEEAKSVVGGTGEFENIGEVTVNGQNVPISKDRYYCPHCKADFFDEPDGAGIFGVKHNGRYLSFWYCPKSYSHLYAIYDQYN